MAQQVAHEIKNPLTPMKLSLQLLERKADSNIEESEIKKTTRTLIEQIATLSDIAGSFSEFAKMPDYKVVEVNLSQIVENAINLYTETVKIKKEIAKDIVVKIDENGNYE